MNERQGLAALFLIVLLIIGLGVSVQRGFIKWPSVKSTDTGGAGAHAESADWNVLGEEYDYVVQTDGSLYWAEHGGDKFWISNNKTAVCESALGQLMSGGTIYLHELTFPASLTLVDEVIVIESYQGRQKIYSNNGTWLLTQLASDPSTAGWGSAEKGRMWFNIADGKIKFWDGSQVQELPSADVSSNDVFYADYTIWKNTTDSKYYAQDSYGNIDYSSTNASYVWNSAAAALPVRGGTLEGKSDIFEMDSPIIWVGGTSTPPSKTLRIIGAGRWSTVFKATTAHNMFEVSFGASVDFEHFYIDMNSQNGHGIYGHDTGGVTGVSDRSFQKGVINDIEIRGITANYWGMYLINPYITNTWDNIYIRSAGGGIYAECDSTGYGNNDFGNIMVSLYGSNKIGVKFYRNGSAISLNSWRHLYIDGGASGVQPLSEKGNIGLELDGSNYNSFSFLEIEHCKYAVKMGTTQSTHGNVILSGFIFVTEEDSVIFNMTADAKQNTVQSVFCSAYGNVTWSTNATLITDANTDIDAPNRYYNLYGDRTYFLPVGQYVNRVEDDACMLYGSMLDRKAQNSIVSANFQINHTGTQTLTISHALVLAPSTYWATLQRTTDVADWDAHVVEIFNVGITSVQVRINVTVASATNPSYAHIIFHGDVNG